MFFVVTILLVMTISINTKVCLHFVPELTHNFTSRIKKKAEHVTDYSRINHRRTFLMYYKS